MMTPRGKRERNLSESICPKAAVTPRSVVSLRRDLVELKHGDAEFLRLDFEGGGTEFVSSADWFIFPRDDGEDGMTGRQFFEYYRRKVGGPHEDESQLAHSSLRSLHLDV